MQVTDCEALRREIKFVADKLMVLRRAADPSNGEALASAMLAYRHLEDAAMRLGKTIQALDGGVSVYDTSQVPKTAA